MPDGFAQIRKGEQRPFYGQETVLTGTLTIAASPAPTVTLYDKNGVPVPGLNGIAVTGYDTGARSAPRVWLNLNTASLEPGFYTLLWLFDK